MEVIFDVVSFICSVCIIDRSNCFYLENIFFLIFILICNLVSVFVYSNVDRNVYFFFFLV